VHSVHSVRSVGHWELSGFRRLLSPLSAWIIEGNSPVVTDFEDRFKRLTQRVSLERDDFKLQLPFPQKLTSDPTSFHRRIEVYSSCVFWCEKRRLKGTPRHEGTKVSLQAGDDRGREISSHHRPSRALLRGVSGGETRSGRSAASALWAAVGPGHHLWSLRDGGVARDRLLRGLSQQGTTDALNLKTAMGRGVETEAFQRQGIPWAPQ